MLGERDQIRYTVHIVKQNGLLDERFFVLEKEVDKLEKTRTIKRTQMAILLGALGAMGPFTIDMYLPSFPTIADDYGTTASLVQISLTACLIGLALGQLVIGPMSDVRGRKKPLAFFLFLYFAASLFCAFAPSIYLFIAGRVVQGFSAAAGLVVSRAVVRDMYSGRELTKFFALLMLVNNLGPILAPIVGGGVLAFTDWSGVFLVLSAIGIGLMLVVTWKMDETLPVERRQPSNIAQTFKSFGSLVKNREFMGYALAQGFMVGGIFAYVSGTPFVYQNIYGASPQLFSLLFGMNGIGIMIGSQVVGRFSDTISEAKFLRFGLWMSAVSSIVLVIMVLIHGPLYSIVIPIFFFVSSIGIIGTSAFSLAMETQGHIAGSASALLGLLPFALGSLTAPLVGIAGENTAVPMGLTIFGASMLAMIAYFGLARGAKKSPQS
ncbi:Bcr/CflA family multidrug efflux MFS transporter [Domibacillus sp. DTU_2020_1001157_1_SI_ALB_TIR_016]|nr:Bcr/CflA family multidrug efflux MFS transporter [Domibacillus sp. DTU_2020_1001157_1_SI_ALB_TIR_016]WNS81552.1 Bcr/CflA family multidrug efflux MFS transporter [Domibacillus sp. DTU_2020_1001157_1_SI_ALB_TIR_016]